MYERLDSTEGQSGNSATETRDPIISVADAILANEQTLQRQVIASQRTESAFQARRDRARRAWLRVFTFDGKNIPRGLTGDELHRRFAELIVELGQVLKADDWEESVNALPTGDRSKQFALAMLRLAMAGDLPGVTRLIREGMFEGGTTISFGLRAHSWIREGLMYELLDIDPPEDSTFARPTMGEPLVCGPNPTRIDPSTITLEGTRGAAEKLRDALDDTGDLQRSDWETGIQIRVLFIEACHLKLVDESEIPDGPLSLDGGRRKLDRLLPLLRNATAAPPSATDPQEEAAAPAAIIGEDVGDSPDPTERIELEDLALSLLFKHPDWTVAQIADRLKVDRKTPYKWEKFRKAAELQGKLKPRGQKERTLRRGHKTRDGQVEAYQDEDSDK
jgi:hypothetical protein